MNLLISISLILAVTTAQLTTTQEIGVRSGQRISATLTGTCEDSYTFSIDYDLGSTALADGNGSTMICVDSGVSTHSLSADTNDLPAWGIFMTCNTPCTADGSSITGGDLYTGTARWVQGNSDYNTENTLSPFTTPAEVVTSSGSVATLTWSGLTAANLVTMGLPNKEQEYYWSCFSYYNSSGHNANLGYEFLGGSVDQDTANTTFGWASGVAASQCPDDSGTQSSNAAVLATAGVVGALASLILS